MGRANSRLEGRNRPTPMPRRWPRSQRLRRHQQRWDDRPNRPTRRPSRHSNSGFQKEARGGVGVSAMRDTLSVMRANMFAPLGGAS